MRQIWILGTRINRFVMIEAFVCNHDINVESHTQYSFTEFEHGTKFVD